MEGDAQMRVEVPSLAVQRGTVTTLAGEVAVERICCYDCSACWKHRIAERCGLKGNPLRR
jgi:hypothetical protein